MSRPIDAFAAKSVLPLDGIGTASLKILTSGVAMESFIIEMTVFMGSWSFEISLGFA
jgi:hypothetical protein